MLKLPWVLFWKHLGNFFTPTPGHTGCDERALPLIKCFFFISISVPFEVIRRKLYFDIPRRRYEIPSRTRDLLCDEIFIQYKK